MKTYREYLEERVSDVVFHATSMQNVLKILSQNKFRLSASIGTGAERDINKGKFYYFSVARSPLSSYVALDPYVANTYLTLNGKKLNQKYKGKAVDYWGPEFRKINPSKNEMEDRIFSDDQYIEDAISYIDEINVLGSYTEIKEPSIMGKMFGDAPKEVEYKIENREMIVLKQIHSIAKKNNIPLYVYSSKEAFTTRNKKKTLDVLSLLKNNGVFKMKADVYPPRKPSDWLAEWKTLLTIPTENIKTYKEMKEKVGDRGYRILDKLLYGGGKEINRKLENEIHNSKSNESVGSFVNLMKKLKLKTTDDVIEFLRNKWSFVKKLD